MLSLVSNGLKFVRLISASLQHFPSMKWKIINPGSNEPVLFKVESVWFLQQVNAIGLRKIIEKYDKCNKGDKGQKVLSKLWCNHSGKSFLHSPMLVELTAIQMKAHESIIASAKSCKVF